MHLVFTHLRKPELARAALVSRKWAEVAADPRLWNALRFPLTITCRYCRDIARLGFTFYPQCFRQLGSLTDILDCPRFSLGVKKVRFLKSYCGLSSMSSLTKVDLHHCGVSSDNLRALSSGGLRSLTLGRLLRIFLILSVSICFL